MDGTTQTRTISFRASEQMAQDLEKRAKERGYLNVGEMMLRRTRPFGKHLTRI